MRPPSGQDDGLRLFAADKQMGRTELLPFTPNVCVLRCRRVQLRGELCSALGAATGEDLAAVGGSHSLSEAMHLGSVTLSGLIGTNSCHGIYTSCKNMLNSGRRSASAAASQNLAAPMEHTNGIIADTSAFCQSFFAHSPHFPNLVPGNRKKHNIAPHYFFCVSGRDFCCASSSSTRMELDSMKPFGVRCQRPEVNAAYSCV